MTVADFGTLSLLVAVAGLLAIVYRLGVDAAVMRLHFDVGTDRFAALYWTAALSVITAAATGSLLIAVLVGPWFGRLFTGLELWPLGALTLLVATTNSMQFVPTVWLRATERPWQFLLYTVSAFIAIAVVTVLLVAGLQLGATGALVGYLAGGTLTLTFASLLLFRLGTPAVDPTLGRETISFGLPLVPHQVSHWFLNVSDRWLIGLLIGLPALQAREQIGIYSFGYQIGYLVALVAVSIQAAWTPILYRWGTTELGPRLHREMMTVASALFVGMAATITLASPYIVSLLAPKAYMPASDIMGIVSFGAAAYGAYVMLVGLIMLTKKTVALALLTTLAAAVNVAANFILIPTIGIYGAAWATVIGYVVYATAAYRLAKRRFPIALDGVKLALLAVIALSAVAGHLTLGRDVSGLPWRLAAIIAVAVVTVMVSARSAKWLATRGLPSPAGRS